MTNKQKLHLIFTGLKKAFVVNEGFSNKNYADDFSAKYTRNYNVISDTYNKNMASQMITLVKPFKTIDAAFESDFKKMGQDFYASLGLIENELKKK
ncbi:hypothetical protein AwWohl_04460 [Gammaproteobacteria bacterium]|nr:hypothetical protein AwWohl_04460 [Gammaproteobacteria bacterium]